MRKDVVQPVDRGWAWIILLGCFMVIFLIVGTLKSFGLFFVEYLQEYDTTSSMVSLAVSIQTAMYSVTAYFVLTLGNKYLTSRKLIMTGGFIAAFGYCLNGFAPTISFLIFSQGILHGIGCALSYGPSLVLLSTYFHKRKGLANSLAYTGGSVGGLLIPLLVRHLLDRYGLQGALIIMSALIFNITVAGALMRSFPVATTVEVNKNGQKDVCTEINVSESPETGSETVQISDCMDKEHVTKLLGSETNSYSSPLMQNEITDGVFDKISRSTCDLYGSLISIDSNVVERKRGISPSSMQDTLSRDESLSNDMGTLNCCRDLFSCNLLRNHKFRLLMVIGYLCMFGSGLAVAFIPPFAKDHNIPDSKIAWLVTISAVSDFIGRFTVAWIADSGVIKRSHIIGSCLVVTSIAAMLNFLYTDFPSFAAYSAIHGLVGGVYFSLFPLLIVEAVGQDNLSNGMAILLQVHGASFMINSFLTGYLRDITGSYRASFLLMGSSLLLGAICLFFEPIAVRLENKRIKR